MKVGDYWKKYVTCEDYTDSSYSPSKVDLLTALKGVSMQPAFLIMKVNTLSGSQNFAFSNKNMLGLNYLYVFTYVL